MNLKEECEDPTQEHVCHWKVLEGCGDVASDEWYESVQLTLWVRLATAHQHNQDQVVD